MPLSVTHAAHIHPLSLVSFEPYENNGFSCDLCGGMGSNHWLYRCGTCEFDAHIGFATAKAQPRAVAPQQRVLPPPPPLQQPLRRPSLLQQEVAQVRRPVWVGMEMNNRAWQGRPVVGMPLQGVNGAGRGRGGGGGLMNQVIQGVVNAAAQQMGQSLVQNILGGGGGGNDLDAIMDVGSAVVGLFTRTNQ